jgi:hypothetical protein
MNGCNYIRERIDQADKPSLLSFEVTDHIAHCGDCERFESERTALRTLVASSVRVNAPVNFNAMLNARLDKVKARRTFWWLTSPGYVRLAAATAGLVIMIFAAQYAGLFSETSNRTLGPVAGSATTPPIAPGRGIPASPVPLIEPSADVARALNVATAPRSRRGVIPTSRVVPPGYLTADDAGVVLVRGRHGDMDVQMPTVSVGAQPLLYVGSGPRPVRNVGTSF